MMNLIIFIFFALLDAGIVGLCGLCYSGREKYREGMILGIHVPPEAVENDEVRALTENYRTGFRRFQRINLAAGILCPAFCFLNTGAGFLVWTLWILEYCLLFPLRSIVSLRKMYVIKKKHHWIRDDDDEYWKNGWYSNPYDRHLFVEDRMNSSSYSINMAHPAAKWWIAFAVFICIAAVSVCIVLAVILGDLDGSSPDLKVTEDQVTLSYSFYDCSFSTDEIQSVELLSKLPEDDYDRVNGGDTDNVLVGYFEGEKTGDVMMFLIKGETPLIRIKLPDQTVFLNSDADGQTEKWYEEINMLREK